MKLTSTACLVGGEVVLPSRRRAARVLGAVSWCRPGRRAKPGWSACAPGGIVLHRRRHRRAAPLRHAVRAHLGRDARGRQPRRARSRLQQLGPAVRRPHLQPARGSTLSKYDAGTPDPYLGVSGPICFPFFGLHHVNIRDAADATPRRRSSGARSPSRRPPITPGCGRHGTGTVGHLARHRLERSGACSTASSGRRLQHRRARTDSSAPGTAEFGFFALRQPTRDHGRDPQRRHRHPHQLDGDPRHRPRPVRTARRHRPRSPVAPASRARS